MTFVVLAPGQQQKRGPSTPEERARFVDIASRFEANPLDTSLQKDREWALLWLIEVPDISVTFCTDTLGEFFKEKYKNSPEITAVTLLSAGRFIIEHPEKANDQEAVNLYAVESVLRAYQSMLKQDPKATSRSLDTLLARQATSRLSEQVKKNSQKCK